MVMTSTRLPVVCPIVSGDTDLDREWAPMGCLTDCFFTFLVVFQWSRAFHVMYVVNRKKNTKKSIVCYTHKVQIRKQQLFPRCVPCAMKPSYLALLLPLWAILAKDFWNCSLLFSARKPAGLVMQITLIAALSQCLFPQEPHPTSLVKMPKTGLLSVRARLVCSHRQSVSHPMLVQTRQARPHGWGGASRNGCGGWMERALPRPPPVCTTNHHLSQTSSGSFFVSISGGVNLRYSLKLSVVLYLMRTLE